MDDAQKRSDFEQSIKKTTMTEDEIRMQKERKAHELQVMVGRAHTALEGNRQLLEKRRLETQRMKFSGERSAWYLRDQKEKLEGFKIATPTTRNHSSREMSPATRDDFGDRQPGGESRRWDNSVSSPLQTDSQRGEKLRKRRETRQARRTEA